MAAGLLVVCLASLTSAQTTDCAKYSIHGISPGMSYRDVWRIMDGKGDERGTEPGSNGPVSFAVYQVEPTPLRLLYDRQISKKTDDARVVMMETKAGILLDTLAERLGRPEVGADQIAGGRAQSAIIWTNDACNVEVTVYPESTGWWQPAHGKMRIRVRALSYAWPMAGAAGRLANAAPAPTAGSTTAKGQGTPSPTAASTTFPRQPDESPAAEGPYLAGVGGVSFPERIEKSYVEPTYPRVALKGELGGRVRLQVVILQDGTVSEVAVVSSSRAGYGFEEAAIEAVKQWRYRPATLNGKAVAAYTSVTVEFR